MPRTISSRFLLSLALLVGGLARAQETQPAAPPPPEERSPPKTAADAEEQLSKLRAFIAFDEPKRAAEPESPAARRLARLKEQAAVLQKLAEQRRLAAAEAAEAADLVKDRETADRRLADLRRAEKEPRPLPDPRATDAEKRLKTARDEVDASGRQARAAREKSLKDLERSRSLRETLAAETEAAERAATAFRADLASEEADIRDYVAAGLEPEVVLLKAEAAHVVRLEGVEAETRLARLKRFADGLLDARISLLETRIAAADGELRVLEAASKEIDRLTDAAIQARFERARTEEGELREMLERVSDWAKPYWRVRRTLVGLKVELSTIARAQKLWEGRIGPVGEVTALAQDADLEASLLADVDSGKLDLYEVVPQAAEELTPWIAAHRAELDRIGALLIEVRDGGREARRLSQLARGSGADALLAAAETERRAAVPPEGVEPTEWFEREALSDAKWSELTSSLKQAAEERASSLNAMEVALGVAGKKLVDARSKRERGLIRYQSALRWTREGTAVDFEAIENALDDVKALPEAVRTRATDVASRATEFWAERVRANDWSALSRAGGALLGAIALLVAAARAIPRTARLLESWKGARAGAVFVVHLTAVLLRRTVFTGLLAFCATAIPLLLGAPRADVALAAVLFTPPFVYRTMRVLVDSLLGREPSTPPLLKSDGSWIEALHTTARRLLVVAALFVPMALLLEIEGYGERNPGFVALLWLLHSLLSYALVLVVALRPRHFLSVARGETGVAARLKTAVLVSYPVVVAALIFLIVLRSLGYTVAAKYFLRQFLETAGWVALAAWLHGRLLALMTRGAPPTPSPSADPTSDEAQWILEGRAKLFDRVRRLSLKLAVYVPAAWLVLELWGMTGTGYEAVFGRPIMGQLGATAALVGAAPTSAGDGITWANLIAAILSTVVAFYVVRFTRDFLRFVALPRTGLDMGLRYTVATLATYMLAAISGVFVLGGQLKIDATVIGGFVAALGVGLGFGLKEIVDNFFSGVIVLVERPIKVGDMITVGSSLGRVDRINMRSTTIMTQDNKGLIVPNKDLISQPVTNWSAGSPTIRSVFRVGIEYGSDTALFRKVVLEVLDSIGLVLKSPSPEVSFTAFGSSSLDFDVFYWIRTSTNWRRLGSDIHFALDMALRKSGISVAFPRQDLLILDKSAMSLRRGARSEAPKAAEPPSSRPPGGDPKKPREDLPYDPDIFESPDGNDGGGDGP